MHIVVGEPNSQTKKNPGEIDGVFVNLTGRLEPVIAPS